MAISWHLLGDFGNYLKDYQQLLPDISRATATRDLTELVGKGIFEMVGNGKRGLHYILMMQK